MKDHPSCPGLKVPRSNNIMSSLEALSVNKNSNKSGCSSGESHSNNKRKLEQLDPSSAATSANTISRKKNTWEARRGKSRRRQQQGAAQVKQAPPTTCSVCQTAENPKYKCPKCRATYCSVACCRQHKQGDACAAAAASKADSNSNNNNKMAPESTEAAAATSSATAILPDPERTAEYYQDLEDDWLVTDEMKRRLEDASDWLRDELQTAGNGPCLRDLLRQVYRASNRVVGSNNKGRMQTETTTPITEREQVMSQLCATHPQFERFLDRLRVVAGVLERQGPAVSLSLHDWLQLQQQNETASAAITDRNNLVLISTAGRPERVARPDDNQAAAARNPSNDDDNSSSSCSSSGDEKDESSTSSDDVSEDTSSHDDDGDNSP